nr:MAG: hypothetical protein [Permutotetraviridae sp.]
MAETITKSKRLTARLSDVSCRYMAALYDPRTMSEEASVPNDTSLSQKVKVSSRGSFSTGTTGYGYIAVQPTCMLTNNAAPGTATTATSAGGAPSLGNAYTNTASVGVANSPWAQATYGSGPGKLTWKLVSCALYVKYAGTELNKGGDIILIEEPTNKSLLVYSYNTAMNYDFAKRVPVTGDWVHVSFTPGGAPNGTVAPVTTSYSNGDPTAVGSLTLGAFVNSAGAAQPYDYEIFACFEVLGDTVRSATSSYADPIGFSAISAAADQYMQLDSVLGIDGFLHGVENQLDNMSGVGKNAQHVQNWAGLAAFLPQIADIATRALSGAATGALKEFGYKKAKPKEGKPSKKLIAPLPPPPPPPRVKAPIPPLSKALLLQRAALKKR